MSKNEKEVICVSWGVHSPHDWLRTRVHKKRSFLDIRRRRRLLQKGYIFRC